MTEEVNKQAANAAAFEGESLSEADTRSKLIDPALYRRGWTEDMIRREKTAGKIYYAGGNNFRMDTGDKRTDYVLRFQVGDNSQPVAAAIIEAKRNTDSPSAGLQQAKGYAARMHVPFVYSSNGYRFVEYDATTDLHGEAQDMAEFPTPQELQARYEAARGFSMEAEHAKPLLQPYKNGEGGRRYYQDAAIRAALEKISKCKEEGKPARALLSLATGAGKTYIAANLLWRLYKAGEVKRALFLCDRDALRTQALGQMRELFGDNAEEAKSTPEGENKAQNAVVHVATYQTLGVDSDDNAGGASFASRHYPPNHFSHIIIDECHRSAWNKWSAILLNNPQAVHIGLTATPRQMRKTSEEDKGITADNFEHFGAPVYEYGLFQGMEDGYLAMCQIETSEVNLDLRTISGEEAAAHGARDHVTGRPLTAEELREEYGRKVYEDRLMLPDRVKAMCKDLFAKLASQGDPRQKTVIFCVGQEHARSVSRELNNLYAEWKQANGEQAKDVQYAFVCMANEGDDELTAFRAEDGHHFIAVTVDLLSTGVDIPRLRNVVFFRYVGSSIYFHQMLGRGSRIHEPSGKFAFWVYDYTDATDWLGKEEIARLPKPKEPPVNPPTEPPRGAVIAEAKGFRVFISSGSRQIVLQNEKGETVKMTTEEYRDHIARRLLQRVKQAGDFRAAWANPKKREELINFVYENQHAVRSLAAVLEAGDYDDFDMLAENGFGALPLTRQERADRFETKNREWLNTMPEAARKVLLALARSFASGGIEELETPEVLETQEVIAAGGVAALSKAGEPSKIIAEAKKRILAA